MRRLFSAFILLAALGIFAGQARAQAIVIANTSVKSSDVTKSDLRDVFTGESSSFKDGSKVTPVLLKAGPVNDAFLSEYVGKPDSAFRAGWRSLVFSGQGSMPKSVDTDAAMVEYVAHTPGAIGYIGKDTPHEGVKVLAVK
jgi:ABC-type phosphate transport system substrate-binding protein